LTTSADELSDRARSLRESFDASFAEAPTGNAAGLVDFLVVTTTTDRYAVRLSEIALVHAERKVTRVLSPMPELLGLADFRGVLTPIYAVALLLGRPADQEPRFLVVARHPQPIGFAFTGLERHARVAASQLALEDTAADPFTAGAVRLSGSTLRILRLTSLVDHLVRRLESSATKDGDQ
jgi:chemotaxis signal transduction protein